MEIIGIFGASFGLRTDDPGESNRALARAIEKKMKEMKSNRVPFAIVAQWEIADAIKNGVMVAIREHRKPGEYLDTEEVVSQAAFIFHDARIVKVIVFAQPFLHRHKCVKLLKNHGFEVVVPKTGWIPFDKESTQWWTRGPIRLLIYAILQKFTGRKGK